MSKPFHAKVAVALECPENMADATNVVLDGEYECGYFGSGLAIVDIGANIGSFSLWANMRWPQSTIHAYEPNPGTFELLRRNTRDLANVTSYECAVYPGVEAQMRLRSRFAGDGEAGLVAYMDQTFDSHDKAHFHMVTVLRPQDLPRCDVLKIDAEGAEAAIIEDLDVKDISLILLEYQNDANRQAIKARLASDFIVEFEDSHPWSPLLANPTYRRDLAGDHFGHLFFVNRRANALQRIAAEARNRELSFRELLSRLPAAAKSALRRRWQRARSRRASTNQS